MTNEERKAINYTNAVFKKHLTKSSKFFDHNDKEISKEKFAILSGQKGYIAAKVSADTFKIVKREYQGVIRNPEKVYDLLKQSTNKEFNPNAPIVILYHPGTDGCFATGYNNKVWTRDLFKDFESKVVLKADTKPIYLFKSDEGLSKFKGIIEWEKDKGGGFEELFFPYHCPCGSNAIINTDGRYYVYNGESDLNYLLAVLDQLLETN